MDRLCNTINSVQMRAESSKLSWLWIIQPFASAFRQPDRDYSIKSPVLESRWNDKWQVTLQLTRVSPTTVIIPYPQNFQVPVQDIPIAYVHESYSTVQAFHEELPNTFSSNPRGQITYELKITFKKLSTSSAASSFKGNHKFSVCIISDCDTDNYLHDSHEDSSKTIVESTKHWLYFETLELYIKIKYIPAVFSAGSCPDDFDIMEGLAALRDVEELKDFTISVGREELKTNRTILALASPVLLAMFTHDFKEKQEEKLYIEDSDVHTVKKFLDFVYTGQNPQFTSITSDVRLFRIAEKYKVQSLRKICFSYIRANITDENGLTELLVSFQHSV